MVTRNRGGITSRRTWQASSPRTFARPSVRGMVVEMCWIRVPVCRGDRVMGRRMAPGIQLLRFGCYEGVFGDSFSSCGQICWPNYLNLGIKVLYLEFSSCRYILLKRAVSKYPLSF